VAQPRSLADVGPLWLESSFKGTAARAKPTSSSSALEMPEDYPIN